MKKALPILLTGTAVSLVLWWAWPRPSEIPQAARPDTDDDALIQETSAQGDQLAPHASPAAAAASNTLAEQDLIAEMQARFGPNIHRPHAQIKLIEQLIAYLQQQYPEDWRSRIGPLLDQLFPELAALLLERFEGLLNYNDWLREHRDSLRAMAPDARRQSLWEQRYATFGEAADEIWAAERRNYQIQSRLVALDSAADLDAQQKLQQYLESIHEAYGEHGGRVIEQRRTELLGRFLDLESVQQELHELPEGERRNTLRSLRAGLGMDEAALQRWDALDQRRAQQWNTGNQYMQRREALVQQGADPTAIAQLREQLLGELAPVIAQEEAAGFFRWSGQRRFGRE